MLLEGYFHLWFPQRSVSSLQGDVQGRSAQAVATLLLEGTSLTALRVGAALFGLRSSLAPDG